MSEPASKTEEVPVDEKRASSSSEDHSNDLASLNAPKAAADVNEAGVARIEALYRVFGTGKGLAPLWLLYISIGAIAYVYSLDENTSKSVLPFGTSYYGSHALLGTIQILTGIVGGVGKPFVAKIADITSRPRAYLMSLVFYVVGFIIIAGSKDVRGVAAGEVINAIGKTGLDLVTDVICADLSPLKWRGLATSLPSAPYIINAFISGFIVDAFAENNWKWAYGLFIILMPVVMAPALSVLFWAEFKAQKDGLVNIASSSWEKRHEGKDVKPTYWRLVVDFFIHIDGVGLILLGFGFALLLVPFSLYKTANQGWHNPSLIAMLVLGGVFLIAFGLWEWKFAKYPLMPKRVINRTFMGALIIDVTYMMSGNMRSTYYSSWVYVVKDWSLENWTYFTNTLTVGLCVFGLLAGLILRATHRYKWLQISGLCIRIVGMGLTLHARGASATDAELVWTQLLIAIGGAFSVVGSRVASQASVPHQDMAQVIANLSLWTSLGGSIGSSIAAAVWSGKMQDNMHKYLPNATDKTITTLYGSIKNARKSDAATRAGVILAYNDTVRLLYIPALVLSFIPLLAASFMQNFYLDDRQNAVEAKGISGETVEVAPSPEANGEKVPAASTEQKA
ncbi:MFS general substrate transporter [Flagelloscypha sp. PMI_526]|nr:MFS general substrate transporter [Flagelloscypha sp. PMI_526]